MSKSVYKQNEEGKAGSKGHLKKKEESVGCFFIVFTWDFVVARHFDTTCEV
jgi:hypothetical protein